MAPTSRAQHWEDVYTRKSEDEVSWFQVEPAMSLALIAECAPRPDAKIIDVGGGASRLVDGLLERGFLDVTVLDLSPAALAKSRARLGERGARVHWVSGDVTAFQPPAHYAIWHDRAVFHFLTSEADRSAYVKVLSRALAKDGHAIVATFAPDGPERCSGLDVVRYDAAALAAALGPSFVLVESRRHEHVTPAGKVQPFTFGLFRVTS